MNQVKRQLSIEESSQEENKKLKRIVDEKKTINCLEVLPNEIFYEIFEYLEGCKLYDAFSNLNARFQHLLTSLSVRLKINLYPDSETILEHRSNHIIIPNKHRIVSLILFSSFWRCASIFTLLTIDSSFSRLESLTLNGMKSSELIPILISLLSLPRLFSITICPDGHLEDIGNVYQIILSLPMLKYNKLSFFMLESSIPLPIATNEQFSAIEYLVMNHCCTLDELIAILSYTPQLCRLTCEQINEPNVIIAKQALEAIPSLIRIFISKCYVDFDELEIFLTKISPQIQVLRVTSARDVTYLDADRWERIISRYLRHLHTFEFKCEETIDEDLEVTPYHELTHRFNSSFWTKRKWLFRIYIDTKIWDDSIVVYSIFPSRKSQTNVLQEKEKEESSINEHESVAVSLVPSETNQLTLVDHSDTEDDELFIDSIGPILSVVQITCLNITRRKIFIGMLINILQYLPNLDSLFVSSLRMVTPRCLSVEETRTLRLVSYTNKITKVNLQRMKDLAQVQFLIDLCPQMQYLEVDCMHGVSPERFIRFISMKNIKYIPNLSSLCLRILLKNDDMFDKLKKMIELEQLRHYYTIKQMSKKIYLRWNLS